MSTITFHDIKDSTIDVARLYSVINEINGLELQNNWVKQIKDKPFEFFNYYIVNNSKVNPLETDMEITKENSFMWLLKHDEGFIAWLNNNAKTNFTLENMKEDYELFRKYVSTHLLDKINCPSLYEAYNRQKSTTAENITVHKMEKKLKVNNIVTALTIAVMYPNKTISELISAFVDIVKMNKDSQEVLRKANIAQQNAIKILNENKNKVHNLENQITDLKKEREIAYEKKREAEDRQQQVANEVPMWFVSIVWYKDTAKDKDNILSVMNTLSHFKATFMNKPDLLTYKVENNEKLKKLWEEIKKTPSKLDEFISTKDKTLDQFVGKQVNNFTRKQANNSANK